MSETNGRDNKGRFALGNLGGPGNPHVQRTAELRSARLSAVTPEDVAAIVQTLIKQALAGDVVAAREVLDRCLGKSTVSVDVTDDNRPLITFSVAERQRRLAEIAQRLRLGRVDEMPEAAPQG